MIIKKNLIASILINSIVIIAFVLSLDYLDVFKQLLFSFVPVFISLIICFIVNFKNDSDVKMFFIAGIYASINFICLIIEYIGINSFSDKTKIFEYSQKYHSEYITVSENNSPVFSIILFTVFSFVLHYFVLKLCNREKVYE